MFSIALEGRILRVQPLNTRTANRYEVQVFNKGKVVGGAKGTVNMGVDIAASAGTYNVVVRAFDGNKQVGKAEQKVIVVS